MGDLIKGIIKENNATDIAEDTSIVRKCIRFGVKLEVLTAYMNDPNGGNGTIANIKRLESYIYNGQKYPIGMWIYGFRRAHIGQGAYAITPHQTQLLEGLGMAWRVRNSIPFETKLQILKDYQSKHGSISNIEATETYVYENKKYPIGAWISVFRRAYKAQGINPKQIEELEGLGMLWDVSIPFKTKLEVLTCYKNDVNGGNGTIAKIKAIETYVYNGKRYPIGDWISNFRRAYKGNSTMIISDSQIQQLEDLGMVWAVRKTNSIAKM